MAAQYNPAAQLRRIGRPQRMGLVESATSFDYLTGHTQAMTKTAAESHQTCVNRFIELANTMKNEGTEINIVSGALMTASALYASYQIAGNAGGLTDSGVEKVSGVYKRELERIQNLKKQSTAN